MIELKRTQKVKAYQWKPGVVLPFPGFFEIPKTSHKERFDSFPAHAVFSLNGRYVMILEGDYVIMHEGGGQPAEIVSSLEMAGYKKV